MQTNTKRSMGFGFRHLSYKACNCIQCRPRNASTKWRRSLAKASRRRCKVEIRKELRDG